MYHTLRLSEHREEVLKAGFWCLLVWRLLLVGLGRRVIGPAGGAWRAELSAAGRMGERRKPGAILGDLGSPRYGF